MKTYAKFSLTALILSVVMIVAVSSVPRPARAAGPWYVAQGGSDANSCLSALTPCATINSAIGKASSSDTIKVATGTYTSTTGSEVVLIDKSLTLSGGWNTAFISQIGTSTLDGQAARQGVRVNSDVIVTQERFIIQNGVAKFCNGINLGGGGICNKGNLTLNDSSILSNTSNESGGGIYNSGSLTLTNTTIIRNAAENGGGIYNTGFDGIGRVTLNNSTVADNAANGLNGGCGWGGGIYSVGGNLTLNNTSISRNSSSGSCGIGGGGGLNISGGRAILNASTIFGNIADTASGSLSSTPAGGGLYNGGTVVLNNSAIVENRVNSTGGSVPPVGFIGYGYGGGIYTSGGTLTLDSSTVSRNTISIINGAGTAWGGGIYATNSAILNLNNGTISTNTAGDNNDSGLGGGLYWNPSSGTATLQNTILASNAASSSPDCNGTIGSTGYNLVGNTSGCTFNSSTGDLLNNNPKFIALGNYLALLAGSPAIDAGNPAGCTDHQGNMLTTDQRGMVRPLDGDGDYNARCDIGAYELDPDNPVRQVFLPLVRSTCESGICGRVSLNGAPAAGVSLELRFFNGASFSTLATTATNANGDYAFSGIPSLAPGQLYYVRYRNYAGTPGRLWVWGTRELTSYSAGSLVEIGNFDIADIVLVSPVAGATVALPYTFQWTRRPATPSDTYEFDMYDPTDGNPYFYTAPPLGYVDSYTLISLPPHFKVSSLYVWEIWVYSPDGGYGISYESRAVHFSNSGLSVTISAQPIQPKTMPDLEDRRKR